MVTKSFNTETIQWGAWELDVSNYTLVNTGEGRGYEIDIERMNTPGQMLDWIVQISKNAGRRART